MDNYTSQKIKITSLLLMIMVVFLHSYNLDRLQGGQILYFEKDYNWFIQNFIANGLTRIAVPLFFLISGFLFISNSSFTLQDYKLKVSKRFKTLVIPYLFWALFGLLFYFVMQTIPQSQGFFTKKLIKDYNFIEWINAIFNEPIPYQLWFLRDLIVMVILSPAIVFCIKKLKVFFLLVVFFFWFQNLDSIFLTSEALLFFSIGIYLKIFKAEFIVFKPKKTLLLLSVWMLILAIKTMATFEESWYWLNIVLLKVSILIGVVAFWWSYDYFQKQIVNNRIVLFTIEFSFFIYLTHEPFLTIIKKVLFAVVARTSETNLIVFFVAPVITIVLSIFVGSILKSKLKSIYYFSTGGR